VYKPFPSNLPNAEVVVDVKISPDGNEYLRKIGVSDNSEQKKQ
jgi:hypothetical protein